MDDGAVIDEGWRIVAEQLIARRAGLGHRRRAAFLRFREASDFERIAGDLEGAVRDNYDGGSLATAEVVYMWKPGSIRSILEGGEPTPIEGVGPSGQDAYVNEGTHEVPSEMSDREILEKVLSAQQDNATELKRATARLDAIERRLDPDSGPVE